MASIVSCPGCRKRLKIGTDKPGGKLRCPACNTPFVLGSRTNAGSAATAEFQAFELFEENVVTDTFEIEEDVPAASKIKPLSKSALPAPLSKSAQPKPAVLPKSAPALPRSVVPTRPTDDLDLLADAPPKPKAPPSPPPKPEPIIPENFGLVGEPPPRPPKAPPRPAIPTHSETVTSEARPAPDIYVEPVAERRSSARTEPPAPPRADVRPPAAPPAPPPAPKGTEFFLPASFDPFATAPKSPIPDMSLDDDTPRLKDDQDPRLIEHDFEVVQQSVRTARDGVAFVEGVTDEEVAEIEADLQDFEELGDVPVNRGRRREQRRRRARKAQIQSDVRGRWAVVHWGLTVQLISLAMLVLAAVLTMFSMFLAMVARAAIGPGILMIIVAGLLTFREVLSMLGYGLCIPAPTKNLAWLWATLALAFAFASMFGYIVALIFPPAFLIMPLTIISWFFYLIYLKSVAEHLRIGYIADESMNLMKLLGLQLMGTMIVWGGMLGLIILIGPHPETADIVGLALVFLMCSGLFGIASLIMGAVIAYKYYYILMNLREELGWRLDSA